MSAAFPSPDMLTSERSALQRIKERVQRMAASGEGLQETLGEVVRLIEGLTPSGLLASILILDDEQRHLLHGAAPSLPAAYNAAIHGIEIGPEVGSCGTAAYHNRPVAVFDIATNPLWANFRDLALQHGLRACWSTPVRGRDGRVIGTFANYYRVVRDPSPIDRELTETVTQSVADIIERYRENQAP